MLIRVKKRWEIPEREATPEGVYLNRRQLMAGGAALMAGGSIAGPALGETLNVAEGTAFDYARNEAYTIDRELTPEDVNIAYNNFYEYGSHKQIKDQAERELKPRPWQITIDGLCDNPMQMDVDELIAKVDLEERLYRHRCVEAWSMTVPWVGFPLAKIVEMASPTADAKFLRMETFGDPEMSQAISTQFWYPWPYTEGVTLDEATNDLALLVVGAYGKVVANSMGAPIRLHLPWKYGFKSLKSIVKFSFVAERPIGFWEELQASEYGFWANVNPEVPHPRWSQATERVLHTNERVPTLLYNGYEAEVADLYSGMQDLGRTLYM